MPIDDDINSTVNKDASPENKESGNADERADNEDTANPQIQADYESVNDREVRIAQGLYPFPEITHLPYKELHLLPSLSQTSVNGLVNVGVSCYFNVILQSLVNIPGIKEYFLAKLHMKEIQHEGVTSQPPSPTEGSNLKETVANRFGELVNIYHSYNDHVLNPYKFIELIKNTSKIFDPQRNQDDAHELLLYILDKLATELVR